MNVFELGLELYSDLKVARKVIKPLPKGEQTTVDIPETPDIGIGDGVHVKIVGVVVERS